MSKFEIILYWSNEDQAFVAEVPELPGCAADGTTRQEALANAEVVISEWLDTARELGGLYLSPKGGSCSPELYSCHIRAECSQNGGIGIPERKRTRKTVLRLAKLEHSKTAVLNSLTSPSSRLPYEHAIREFTDLVLFRAWLAHDCREDRARHPVGFVGAR